MYTFHDVIFLSVGIEWDMIVERVFLSILNQMETHLVQNRKVNCHHDHIPFNVKEKYKSNFFIVERGPDLELSERLASIGIRGAQLKPP